jgi:Galactose oxidase, central domain
LFGGKKTTGPTTSALQNDIWKATVACTAVAPAACTTTTTWTQISGGGVGTGFPTPRAGAGGGFWSQNRLVIYGGTDANGALNDLWEYDFTANAWRQPALDQTAGVLTPPTRSGFAMTADQGQQRIYAFGGLAGAAVTDQMWLTGHESAAKLLVKAPFSVPNVDQAQNVTLSIDAMGTSGEQVFIWDGATWRYVASTNFEGGAHIVGTPTVSATSFLQPDGNFYLLFMQAQRNQFTYSTFTLEAPVTMDRLKITVDFQ